MHPGFPTEVFNVLGAGDGFAAGFLSGWLRNSSLLDAGKFGNACGSLVVSRHGCAPAMPSSRELTAFLDRSETITRPHDDPQIVHLHRTTTGRMQRPRIFSLAFDHRRQFAELAGTNNGDARIGKFKRLMARALLAMPPEHSGAIIDDRYGFDALTDLTGSGRWLGASGGNRGLAAAGIRGRPQPAHRHCGPGRPNTSSSASSPTRRAIRANLQRAQNETLLDLAGGGVFATGHRWLLEVIPPDFETDPGLVVSAVEELYRLGLRPDWWKLPPLSDDDAWAQINAVIQRHDPQCGGVVVLGYDRPQQRVVRRVRIRLAIRLGHRLCDRPFGLAAAGGGLVRRQDRRRGRDRSDHAPVSRGAERLADVGFPAFATLKAPKVLAVLQDSDSSPLEDAAFLL